MSGKDSSFLDTRSSADNGSFGCSRARSAAVSSRGRYMRAQTNNPALVSIPSTASFQRPTPKTGRNEPCPCGSGKKYKKCCGALSRTEDPLREQQEPGGPAALRC